MAVLKGYIRNRSRPEGCITEGYGTEEVIEFYLDYMDFDLHTRSSEKPITVFLANLNMLIRY